MRCQGHHRRTKDVPGVLEPEADAGADFLHLAVGDQDALLQCLLHVGTGGERLFAPAQDTQHKGVLLLDAGRVGQHQGQEIARGRRAVDRPGEALADQVGQVAAVVDVGVAEQDGVDVRRAEGEGLVAPVTFGSGAEDQPTVEQEPQAAGLDQVHRPGHLAGCPPEGDGRPRGACGKKCRHDGHCMAAGQPHRELALSSAGGWVIRLPLGLRVGSKRGRDS
jgi:hypothetical protein